MALNQYVETINIRRGRNAATSILRLPEEVVVQIMRDVKDATGRSHLSWIRPLTHVLHHWRSIALRFPFLWTSIEYPPMTAACVDAFVRRSGTLQLSIVMRSRHKTVELGIHSSAIFDLLGTRNAVSRISSFILQGRYSSGTSLDLSTSPLKKLELWGCSHLYTDWNPRFELDYLYIRRGDFHRSFVSCGITTLILKDPTQQTIPPASDFFSMLASLPNLRCLVLKGVLDSLLDGAEKIGDTPPNLTFPLLTVLELSRDHERHCAEFLSWLTFPSLKQLCITIEPYDGTELQHLKPELIKLLGNTSIMKALVSTPLYMEMTLSTWQDLYSFCPLNDLHSPIFRLKCPPPLWYELLAELPHGQVEAFKLNVCDMWALDVAPTDFLTRLLSFAGLTSLKTIAISKNDDICSVLLDVITPVCDCLQPSDERSFERNMSLPNPLPACMSCRDFAASHLPELQTLNMEYENFLGVNLEKLVNTLGHRIDCGRPLGSIKLAFRSDFQRPTVEKYMTHLLKGKGDVIEVMFVDLHSKEGTGEITIEKYCSEEDDDDDDTVTT